MVYLHSPRVFHNLIVLSRDPDTICLSHGRVGEKRNTFSEWTQHRPEAFVLLETTLALVKHASCAQRTDQFSTWNSKYLIFHRVIALSYSYTKLWFSCQVETRRLKVAGLVQVISFPRATRNDINRMVSFNKQYDETSNNMKAFLFMLLLPVVSRERNGEDVLGVSHEAARGAPGLDLPQTESSIPRPGPGKTKKGLSIELLLFVLRRQDVSLSVSRLRF